MDAVTKAEENEFVMRLEDVIPEVTGKKGLPQIYLKIRANAVSRAANKNCWQKWIPYFASPLCSMETS